MLGAESIVASGNLAHDGDSVEAALLVEDAWQRQGVGTVLFAFLLREAASAGYSAVVLHTHAENRGVQRMIRRAAHRGEGPALWPAHFDGPILTYLLPLVPLTCLWDGVVSQLRAYTMDELRQMTAGTGRVRWQIGQIPIARGQGRLTYIVGIPC